MEKKNNIITISRQYGAGGGELGLLLSKELKIPLYNHQILAETVKRTGIPENILKAMDERGNRQQENKLKEILMLKERKALEADTVFDLKNLYTIQEKTIQELAEQGPCIFVGRQADYALRKREDVLSIFIYAEKEWRISRMIQRERKTYAETAKELRRVDKERRNYCKYYTGREWEEYTNYDYALNSSTLKMQVMEKIICQEVKMHD